MPGPATRSGPQPGVPTVRSPLLLPLLGGVNLLGALALDAYLPAFGDIGRALSASPLQMQQTLSAYFLAFGVANLLAGPLADCVGRRPVVLGGVLLNALAFLACAFAQTPQHLIGLRLVQGLACSAAVSITLAIVRDVHDAEQAQRAITRLAWLLVLGPVLAPMAGGWLVVSVGWRALFGVLALVSFALLLGVARGLPETLARSARQPWRPTDVARGYREVLGSGRFVLLCVAFSACFNGAFIYVLAAPAFLGIHLGLEPPAYALAFGSVAIAAGLLLLACQRLTRHLPTQRVVMLGFALMVLACLANVIAHLAWPPHVAWALWPITAHAVGLALVAAPLQVLALDVCPSRRGLSSALQATGVALTNAAVAGLLVPLTLHSAATLAWGSALMTAIGLLAWMCTTRREPTQAATHVEPCQGGTPLKH